MKARIKAQERLLMLDTPRQAYKNLIDRISGRGTWDLNPYVFVYNFELWLDI